MPELWTIDPDARALVQRALAGADQEIRGEHRERVQIAILPELCRDPNTNPRTGSLRVP